MDPYKIFPVVENEKYLLRAVTRDDVTELLSVYSDEKAVPYFNGDNCHGDDFHYTTIERMLQAIDFWIMSYDNGWFVRWVIVDKEAKKAIGTVEYFKRAADTTFNDCGVLRLDLRSDYERSDVIKSVVEAFLSVAF